MKKAIPTVRLSAYSLFSATWLLLNSDSKAEVIYTDLDPDVVLSGPFDTYAFDMDNSGSNEMIFYNVSSAFYNYSYFSYKTIQVVAAWLQGSQNYLSALMHASYYGIEFYPRALTSGALISANNQWHNASWEQMAAKTFFFSGAGIDECPNCFWYGLSVDSTVNGYLAVKFKTGSDTHYGWIRCDVLDTGRTLIIKDYAYETIPDNAILAGDTITYVGINEITNTLNATVYSFGKAVYVQMETVEPESEIKIYTTSGALIYNNGLSQTNSRIDLSLKPAGSYVVEVRNKEAKMTKVVVIE